MRVNYEDQITVGVTSRHGIADWLDKNTAHYIRVLRDRGVQVVIVSPDTPAVMPDGRTFTPAADGTLSDAILDGFDGIVLTGGGDVHPSYFGQEMAGTEQNRISRERDAMELTLTRSGLSFDIPILGICRGCQVLNIAAGGGLIQHFDGHRLPDTATAYHDVTITPGTRLHAASDANTIRVNTFHHQGIDSACLAPGYVASGYAHPDTWLVEAIESPNHKWVLGVQWHPERTFELEQAHMRIWKSYLDACVIYKDSKER